MNGRKWKKWVTLAAVTGMLISQIGTMPTWAAEEQDGNVVMETVEESTVAEELIESKETGAEEEGTAESQETNASEETAESAETSEASEESAETVETSEAAEAITEFEMTNESTEESILSEETEEASEETAESQAAEEETEETAETEEEIVGETSWITWTVDGDTAVIKGEGEYGQVRNAISCVKYVRFENCKVIGSMNGAFSGLSNLESIDFSGLDTSQVTDMGEMFNDCSGLTSLDLSSFNTAQVTNMSGMFSGCSSLTDLDISGFDTSQVTNMNSMFFGCDGLTDLDISGFDTAEVRKMGWMFCDCGNLTSLDVSNFNTSRVTGMEYMFSYCDSLTSLDLSSFDTSQLTDMEGMFGGSLGLKKLDMSSFDLTNIQNINGGYGLFYDGCQPTEIWTPRILPENRTIELGETYINPAGIETNAITSDFLSTVLMLKEIRWTVDGDTMVITGEGDFGQKIRLEMRDAIKEVKHIRFENCKVIGSMASLFTFSDLESIDLSGLDTSQVTDMSYMFIGCSGLTGLDLSGFDTSQVTDMSDMFYGCSGLTGLDLSGFDTFQVTDMTSMFYGCEKLESLNMSSFDMANVSSVSNEYGGMFTKCQLKELKTPKAMPTDCVIELNGIFCDPIGTETDALTVDFLSTVLTFVRNVPAPDPAEFTVVGTIGGRNVTFSTDTEDAVIYYSSQTSNLTTADTCVQNGETILFENFYGTIYARAYANGQWGNVSRLILKIPVVSKPVITSSNGVVTIRTSTPNSTIYYTTDGSDPSPTNGKRLTGSAGSFTVPVNCTVKAIAVRSCFTNSEIASAAVIAKKLGAPSFAVKGVIGGRAVTFNSTETQGEIYYSFTTSNITTKDLHVKPGETVLFENYYGTVYARTYVNGQWSNVSRLILKIPVVNKPTITAAGNGKVKITTTTPNCAIYYTTDGSTPSPTHGTRINSSSSIITVGSGKTVKAIAVRSCFTNSEVVTYK